MFFTIARTKDLQLLLDEPIERLLMDDIAWFWVDFESANEEEITLLSTKFKFSSLAIEDCLEYIERPKVDFYDTYNFFIFNSLDQITLQPVELDLFLGDNYVVTFHKSKLE